MKVKLKSAGLNHRDLFIMNNRKEMQVPLVLGSDGAGIITEIGESVSRTLLQNEVIINLVLDGIILLKYPSYQRC